MKRFGHRSHVGGTRRWFNKDKSAKQDKLVAWTKRLERQLDRQRAKRNS